MSTGVQVAGHADEVAFVEVPGLLHPRRVEQTGHLEKTLSGITRGQHGWTCEVSDPETRG
jgi:hypothetical protein